MKKSDLRSGFVVETRDGTLFLVVGDFITKEFDYELLSKYDENMVHDIVNSCDIMKVYEYKNERRDNNAATIKMLFDRECLTLLWERKERIERNLTEHEVEILKALQALELLYKYAMDFFEGTEEEEKITESYLKLQRYISLEDLNCVNKEELK